jgi:leucyl aminopeptidase (aminopeptidase T)
MPQLSTSKALRVINIQMSQQAMLVREMYKAEEIASYNSMSEAEKAKVDEMRKERDLLIEEISEHKQAVWCLHKFMEGKVPDEGQELDDGPQQYSEDCFADKIPPSLEEVLEFCRRMVKRIRDKEEIQLPYISFDRY